jgi:hypothetical protein
MTKIIMLAVAGWFVLTVDSPAQTQVTNVLLQPPSTRLEAMESTVGKVVLKSRTELGTVSTAAGSVTVSFKENSLVGENAKEQGLVIAIKGGGQSDDRILIDYDELDSLAGALDSLSRFDWSTTSMASFDASYTSKAGLRVDASGNRRTGKITFSIRSGHMTRGINLAPEYLTQLRSLVDQAKLKLDELRQA